MRADYKIHEQQFWSSGFVATAAFSISCESGGSLLPDALVEQIVHDDSSVVKKTIDKTPGREGMREQFAIHGSTNHQTAFSAGLK